MRTEEDYERGKMPEQKEPPHSDDGFEVYRLYDPDGHLYLSRLCPDHAKFFHDRRDYTDRHGAVSQTIQSCRDIYGSVSDARVFDRSEKYVYRRALQHYRRAAHGIHGGVCVHKSAVCGQKTYFYGGTGHDHDSQYLAAAARLQNLRGYRLV